MSNFGGVFHDWIDGPWEQARGYLREELEQLHISLGFKFNRILTTDGTLNNLLIQGDPTGVRKYVANSGSPSNAPKWETAVYNVLTDDTFVEGGPITGVGTISATELTQAAVALSIHSLAGGI